MVALHTTRARSARYAASSWRANEQGNMRALCWYGKEDVRFETVPDPKIMNEVAEIGSQVKKLKVGDRVVVPFTISCGTCWFCERSLFSLCDISNPDKEAAQKAMGQSPAGLFGYSHMLGGFPGGQAEYLRVPFADAGPVQIPEGLDDEQVLFLSDIFPTGYMAAESAQIQHGDTVAVWGCGR